MNDTPRAPKAQDTPLTFLIGDRIYYNRFRGGHPFWITLLEHIYHPEFGAGFIYQDDSGEYGKTSLASLYTPYYVLKHEPAERDRERGGE